MKAAQRTAWEAFNGHRRRSVNHVACGAATAIGFVAGLVFAWVL